MLLLETHLYSCVKHIHAQEKNPTNTAKNKKPENTKTREHQETHTSAQPTLYASQASQLVQHTSALERRKNTHNKRKEGLTRGALSSRHTAHSHTHLSACAVHPQGVSRCMS